MHNFILTKNNISGFQKKNIELSITEHQLVICVLNYFHQRIVLIDNKIRQNNDWSLCKNNL